MNMACHKRESGICLGGYTALSIYMIFVEWDFNRSIENVWYNIYGIIYGRKINNRFRKLERIVHDVSKAE